MVICEASRGDVLNSLIIDNRVIQAVILRRFQKFIVD